MKKPSIRLKALSCSPPEGNNITFRSASEKKNAIVVATRIAAIDTKIRRRSSSKWSIKLIDLSLDTTHPQSPDSVARHSQLTACPTSTGSCAPHLLQKRASAGLAEPHCTQKLPATGEGACGCTPGGGGAEACGCATGGGGAVICGCI